MIRRIGFACLFAAPFLAQAQTSGTCTAATLSGTYSLTRTGRAVSSAAVVTQVYQAVGTLNFDGVGSVTAALTANTNQTPGVEQKLTGNYTIPANCVGTLNFVNGETASYVLIPYNSGKDYVMTGEDATYELTGSGGPQPVACVNSTLSGVFAFSGNGFALLSGVLGGVYDISGLLQFDGVGGIMGDWSISTNETTTADTVVGQYMVTSACVANATVRDPDGTAYALSFAMSTADGSNAALTGAAVTDMFTGTMHSTFTNPGLAVANAAGVSGGTPPGSLFSIYGSDLSTSNGQAVTTTWPTMLGGASVTVNGEAAPLYYVSPTQINAQMPLDAAPGVATVVVKSGSTLSNSVAATVPATAIPGIFIYGANRAVAQNLPSYTLNSAAAPAPAGSYIVVYFTGGGPVQPGLTLETGVATPNQQFPITETYSATVGGIAATAIPYIGLTPGLIGVYQADIQIPMIAAGNHSLIITINGVNSNSTVIATN
jgi:uncharacterized protein (TIGR03437 family)